MKNYKTSTVQIEVATWEPEYCYFKCNRANRTYTYDTYKPYAVFSTIIVLAFCALLIFVSIYFANIWGLDTWYAVFWLLPFIVMIGLTFYFMVQLDNIYDNLEAENERRARQEVVSNAWKLFEEKAIQKDDFLKTHPLEALARKYVDFYNVSTESFLLECQQLESIEDRAKVFELVDKYKKYRESIKK